MRLQSFILLGQTFILCTSRIKPGLKEWKVELVAKTTNSTGYYLQWCNCTPKMENEEAGTVVRRPSGTAIQNFLYKKKGCKWYQKGLCRMILARTEQTEQDFGFVLPKHFCPSANFKCELWTLALFHPVGRYYGISAKCSYTIRTENDSCFQISFSVTVLYRSSVLNNQRAVFESFYLRKE